MSTNARGNAARSTGSETAATPAPVWKRLVSGATPWQPVKSGESLVGHYLRSETRQGDNGAYDVAVIRTDAGDEMSVSGAGVTRPLASVKSGSLVRIVYEGTKRLSGGRNYKEFTVDVADDTIPF